VRVVRVVQDSLRLTLRAKMAQSSFRRGGVRWSYGFSSMLAVKPMPRRLGADGLVSSPISLSGSVKRPTSSPGLRLSIVA
jgi:hypothetical protein